MSNEYIEHEVKLRVHEWKLSSTSREIKKITEEIKQVDRRIDIKFNLFYGLMFAALVLPKIIEHLHVM